MDELTELWKRTGSDRVRLYLLLGLNCGFTQIDIATLEKRHCHLDAVNKNGQPAPYIKRFRNKSRRKKPILGKWRLWPETAYLLGQFMAKPNKLGRKGADLALLNEDGKPLVRWSDGAKLDSIRLSWRRLIKTVNSDYVPFSDTDNRKRRVAVERIRPLSFKFMRKTGSNAIRKMGGKEMSELHLCHRDMTEGAKYNNGDFRRLGGLLRKYREKLEPMFAALPLHVPKPKMTAATKTPKSAKVAA